MNVIFRLINEADLEYIRLINKGINTYDLSKLQRYSFVATHDDDIIGYVLAMKSIILTLSIKNMINYESIGKVLINNVLSLHMNSNISVIISADDNTRIDLYTRLFKFKMINILYNHYKFNEHAFKLRLDDIYDKRANMTNLMISKKIEF